MFSVVRDVVLGQTAIIEDEIESIKSDHKTIQESLNKAMTCMGVIQTNMNEMNMQMGVQKSMVDAYASVFDIKTISKRIEKMETDLADIRKVYVKNTAETLLEVQRMKQIQDEDREVFQSILVTMQKRIDDLSKNQ